MIISLLLPLVADAARNTATLAAAESGASAVFVNHTGVAYLEWVICRDLLTRAPIAILTLVDLSQSRTHGNSLCFRLCERDEVSVAQAW